MLDRMIEDFLVVGGGPAGLAAALSIGRARRSTCLIDGGSPRNAAATHLHNFVTRDGTPPAEFRAAGRAQLARYPNVRLVDGLVHGITGEKDRFVAETSAGSVTCRRVLLTLGMIDLPLPIPGYAELWGTSIFQCPYCHGWEHGDEPFGVLATSLPLVDWSPFLTSWSRDVIVFTGGAFEVPRETKTRLQAKGVALEERPVASLRGEGGKLAEIVLADDVRIARSVLFARPPQRQATLVTSLGLALDEGGYVALNERKETSVPGIYAAGDLSTQMQGAIMAAAGGVMAAAMATHELVLAG